MVTVTFASVHFQISIFRSAGDSARGEKIVLTINIKFWIAVKQSSSLISSGQHAASSLASQQPRRRAFQGQDWPIGVGKTPWWGIQHACSTARGKEASSVDGAANELEPFNRAPVIKSLKTLFYVGNEGFSCLGEVTKYVHILSRWRVLFLTPVKLLSSLVCTYSLYLSAVEDLKVKVTNEIACYLMVT